MQLSISSYLGFTDKEVIEALLREEANTTVLTSKQRSMERKAMPSTKQKMLKH